MKAVVCTAYGPPEVLQITQVNKPIPKDNEVLIKIRATTVTVADFRIRSFTIPKSFRLIARFALGFRKPRKPILGSELSGEIEAVGKRVNTFKPGDQICAMSLQNFGGYALYKCLSENGVLALKPKNLSFESSAALCIGGMTALHYLQKAKIQKGQKILIYGASGSVGSYAVQLAAYFGADVTAVCSTTNVEWVKKLGARKVIDYTKQDFTESGPIYDIFFEAVDKTSFKKCLSSLKKGGSYINISMPLPSLEMIQARLNGSFKIYIGETAPRDVKNLQFIRDLAEAGRITPALDRTYTLDQIVEAHHYVGMGHKKGNVAITVNSSQSGF